MENNIAVNHLKGIKLHCATAKKKKKKKPVDNIQFNSIHRAKSRTIVKTNTVESLLVEHYKMGLFIVKHFSTVNGLLIKTTLNDVSSNFTETALVQKLQDCETSHVQFSYLHTYLYNLNAYLGDRFWVDCHKIFCQNMLLKWNIWRVFFFFFFFF